MLPDQETKPKIKFKTWIVLAALAITGQIAWAVENTWFNSFVYETITPDPRPVSWMVAASDRGNADDHFHGHAQRPHAIQMGASGNHIF